MENKSKKDDHFSARVNKWYRLLLPVSKLVKVGITFSRWVKKLNFLTEIGKPAMKFYPPWI